MSHHGGPDSEYVKNSFKEELEALKLGATWNFPDGKVSSDDLGEIRCAVSADMVNGRVRIDFGKMLSWISLTPDQARFFADSLTEKAFQCRGIK